MQGTISKEERNEVRSKVAKPLLWIGMVSMSMVFAGLTSAYVIREGKGDWLKFELPHFFYMSTAIIMISSVTMNWTLSSAKKNHFKNLQLASLLTFVLGLAFVVSQFKAWGFLTDKNIYFTGKGSNPSGSFLFILTALHMAHLFFGLMAVFVVYIKSIQKKYNSQNHLGIQLCAIFWHFLDALWIYLFLFLLFIR